MPVVYYIDDDPTDRDIFVEIMDLLRQPVQTFSAATHLFDVMNNPPAEQSVIFLDINMPVINGLDTLEFLRNSVAWSNVPIIMLSTSSAHHFIFESHLKGANYYIVKPSSYDKFKEALRHALTIDWSKRKTTSDNFVYQPK
ncbi:MAG: response regulator [Chitinophagaceae bacterium]|nr:MAG: response regulator [Chitinophagaceae bacterium]